MPNVFGDQSRFLLWFGLVHIKLYPKTQGYLVNSLYTVKLELTQ